MRAALGTFCILRAVTLSVGVTTFSAAALFTNKSAVAKSGHISVKISPEYTRSKKGAGQQPVVTTKPDTSVSKRTVKEKQLPGAKTPSPGGPVAIPYPN
jgi:hypothetical protein